MNASLSEYLLPLLFVVFFVVISLRKGMKKKQEEMAKATLPGHNSMEEVAMREPLPAPSVQKTGKKPQQSVPKPVKPAIDVPVEPSVPIAKDVEEDSFEPVLNIEDTDDIKKAVIYTEIFKRKDY